MSGLSPTLSRVQERFRLPADQVSSPLGQDQVVIPRERYKELAAFLKDDPELSYDMLTDLTAVDKGPQAPVRFEVVCHFYSFKNNSRVRVKSAVPQEDPRIDSLSPLYGLANWLEREVWDMFGVKFNGHPNMKRLLMYESFVGHPLRKDYPLNKQQPIVPLRKRD